MIAALVLGGLVLLSIVFFLRIEWGLWLVAFLLPFETIGSFSLTATGYPVLRLVQIAGAALVLAYAARLFAKKDNLRWSPVFAWLVAFGVWALVPVAFINYGPLWRDYISAIYTLTLCAVFIQLTNTKTLNTMLKAVGLSLIFVVGFGWWQFATDFLNYPTGISKLYAQYSRIVFGFPRIHSTLSEPLFLANFLLTPVLFSLGASLAFIKNKKLWWSGFGVLILTFLLTTSRGGFAAFVIGLVWLCVWLVLVKITAPMQLAKTILLAGGVGILVGALVLVLSSGARAHITTFIRISTSNIKTSGSYTERQEALRVAFHTFKEKPLTGFGIGGYTYKLQNYPMVRTAGQRIAVNNQYVELAVETGVIGLILFLGFIVQIFRSVTEVLKTKQASNYKVYLLGLSAGLLAVLTQFMSFSAFFLTYPWVLMGITAGLAYSMSSKKHLNPTQSTLAKPHK